MSRSALSCFVLFAATLSSVATSGSSTTVDPCANITPIAPYTDVVCIQPGDVHEVGFALHVDLEDMPVIVDQPNWLNTSAMLDSVESEVVFGIDAPRDDFSGDFTNYLATSAANPIDEALAFVDDPMIGCLDMAGDCVSFDWTLVIENTGDQIAVVHYDITAGVAGHAATIHVGPDMTP